MKIRELLLCELDQQTPTAPVPQMPQAEPAVTAQNVPTIRTTAPTTSPDAAPPYIPQHLRGMPTTAPRMVR